MFFRRIDIFPMSKKSRAKATAGEIRKAISPAPPCPRPANDVRWKILLAGGSITLSALAAYHDSFSCPFIFDDKPGIEDNLTIRHLWGALNPPHGPHYGALPVAGRPVANLSLAVNYALGGWAVQGYHAMNLAIHVLAGLALFGSFRRTLLQAPLRHRFRADAWWLALAVAALWTLHPLQTESVTYISQRAESLMGLFYLLTLYCFIRGTEGQKPEVSSQKLERGSLPLSACSLQPSAFWLWASFVCCLSGMASKEVMVSAPLMVWLYDRTFVAGTFREAWKQRWRFYAGLAMTWLLLAYLVAGTRGRGGTAGFGANITVSRPYAGFGANITWGPYALTQFRAIVHYLRLALWPGPLVFDYGTSVASGAAEIAPYAVIVSLLIIATLVELRRRPMIGFAACWFFAILAPTSSVVPVVTQTMAEHRMYLALAPLMALAVMGLFSLLGRRSGAVFFALAIGWGCVTARRNEDYRSALALWTDTVKKCPDNARAHYTLGDTLRISGEPEEAIAEFRSALQIDPNYAKAHDSLANLLEKIPGQQSEAISEYRAALRLDPDFAYAHYNLALALTDMPGGLPGAISEYEIAVRIKPDFVEARINLGRILLEIPDRLPEAISEFEAALRTEPGLAEAQCSLGIALAKIGKFDDAIAHLKEAIRLRPNDAEADSALGFAFLQTEQYPEAIGCFQQALKIVPNDAATHDNLGASLLRMGRLSEAADQFDTALKLDAEFNLARLNLAGTLARMNRVPEAIRQLDVLLQTGADDEITAAAQKMLAQLQATNGSTRLKN